MSLMELVSGVESHEKTLTVVNANDEEVSDLRERFRDRNIRIESATVAVEPSAFVVLSQDGEFITAVALEDLMAAREQRDPEFVSETYRPILDHLDETMFTSYSSREMVAASREIEDRAWRIGAGELHAGFQTLSVFDHERETYERLGETEGLSVHVYAAPEGTVPAVRNFTLNVERTTEIRNMWFVAYDGAGVDDNKCALLAEEREDDRFYGFWSYDPTTVDYMIEYLSSTYGFAEPDEGSGVKT